LASTNGSKAGKTPPPRPKQIDTNVSGPTDLDEAVRIMGVYPSGMEILEADRALIVGVMRTFTGEHE
jgi:hypothetical protein